MKSTNKTYFIPFHNTARFIDGKIVEEYGFWDNSEITADLLIQERDAVTTANDSIVE